MLEQFVWVYMTGRAAIFIGGATYSKRTEEAFLRAPCWDNNTGFLGPEIQMQGAGIVG
jgi:hypothetical protein